MTEFFGSTSGAALPQSAALRASQPCVCVQLDAIERRLPVSTATGNCWTEVFRHWVGALLSLQFRRLIGSTFNWDFFFYVQPHHSEEASSRFKSMWWFLWQNDDVSVTQNKSWPTQMAYILRKRASGLLNHCFIQTYCNEYVFCPTLPVLNATPFCAVAESRSGCHDSTQTVY